MKLTLHYKNEEHKKDFPTTETFHNVSEKRIRNIIESSDKKIVKAYVNGRIIDIYNF